MMTEGIDTTKMDMLNNLAGATVRLQRCALRVARQVALDAAFLATPTRFKGRRPRPYALPTAAWINPPRSETNAQKTNQSCTVNL